MLDDGIVKRAQSAFDIHEQAKNDELNELNNVDDFIENYSSLLSPSNPPTPTETQYSIDDYAAQDSLILHYDGIQNTRSGNNPNATVWEDLTDNHNDGILNGFNTSTGFYSSEENGYVLLGHNSYIESTNNLGLIGDAEYTIEIVCKPWSDEKASMTGPDFSNLFDYGTVYNEVGDEGKITNIKINRANGNIKNDLVNMYIDYSGFENTTDNTLSLSFLKNSGQLSTSNTNAFKVKKNNINLPGYYILDNGFRLEFRYY